MKLHSRIIPVFKNLEITGFAGKQDFDKSKKWGKIYTNRVKTGSFLM